VGRQRLPTQLVADLTFSSLEPDPFGPSPTGTPASNGLQGGPGPNYRSGIGGDRSGHMMELSPGTTA